MRLRDCKAVVYFLFVTTIASAQYSIKGVIKNQNNEPVQGAEVYNRSNGDQIITRGDGSFEFTDLEQGTYYLSVFSFDYKILERQFTVTDNVEVNFVFKAFRRRIVRSCSYAT